MSPGEVVVLSLIIAAFAVFAVTLAWVSWGSSRTTDKVSRVGTRHPAIERHPSNAEFVVDD